MTLGLFVLLLVSTATAAYAIPWPEPDVTSRPIFHIGGLDNRPGYVGDANGMMYRDDTKLFHVAWQCVPFNTSGLQWCHAVSEDFVSWKTLPPMINRSGAESGGVAQLPNGDIVAIFNEVGGGGHWQARPTNLSDPFLTFWEDTHPNGTGCSGRCAATPGIPGTDLSQAFLDGSGDGKWRVILS